MQVLVSVQMPTASYAAERAVTTRETYFVTYTKAMQSRIMHYPRQYIYLV